MAKLKDLVLVEIEGRYYIRADWDNDRQQGVVVESTDPYDVIEGLDEFVYLLRQEKNAGRI